MSAESVLARAPLFAMLDGDTLSRLLPYFTERGMSAGEQLLVEGEPAASLFVVVSGKVLVCKQVTGATEALVARLGPGAHLGEIDLVDAECATATVIAETDGLLLELSQDRLRRMLVSDRALFTQLTKSLLHELAVKVRDTNDKVRHTIAWGLDATGDLEEAG